jgi:hypothetical protein
MMRDRIIINIGVCRRGESTSVQIHISQEYLKGDIIK